MKTENNKINYYYEIFDNMLIIYQMYVDKAHQRKGYGTSFFKELENLALKSNCNEMRVISELTKIALSFWLKNGFNTDCDDNKEIINFVLDSKNLKGFVKLYKNIK